ncbi:hypothetical protein [Bradyrhizobium sp. Leo121]|uniref:hypothetical protein n=1 Tax=Bradyrhizobium sp. Leo121 TaxID=1571195 RepID=UPI0010295D00|nr:hypothetical protein [Bradyrhizobium sp. Leo121]RZN19500.1 hypothetical protein CWO90_35305 [Bradyrhizobium sp. Leo121]
MTANWRKEKPIHHQFEDELAVLIDRYLLEGIEISDLKQVLRFEAENEHEEIRRRLRHEQRRSA